VLALLLLAPGEEEEEEGEEWTPLPPTVPLPHTTTTLPLLQDAAEVERELDWRWEMAVEGKWKERGKGGGATKSLVAFTHHLMC